MNNVISFTPAELAAFIGTIAGVCAGIATIVGIIVKLVIKIKAPEAEQNRRIKVLEEKVEVLEKQKTDDTDHFEELEKTNKVILRTLQALLNLSLGVSDTEALKKVSEDLNDFILNK